MKLLTRLMAVQNITDIINELMLTLAPDTRVSNISVLAYTSIGPGGARMLHNVLIPSQPIPREFTCPCRHSQPASPIL